MKTISIAIMILLARLVMAGPTVYYQNGDIINYGDAEERNHCIYCPVVIAYDSARSEPRYQAMLDDVDMKALIFINAYSRSNVLRIEGVR